jgi:predicted metal-dependent hydrolase
MNLDIEGIGKVQVDRSERARRISIRVCPSGVRLIIPVDVSLDRGKAFLSVKKEWVRRHVYRIDCMSKEFAETARTARPLVDRENARKKIIKHLRDLSEQYNLPFERVMIRNQKTRWGSCSDRNTISLNIKLARLPEELMDYVIMHELVHTKVKGHGKKFWNLLNELTENAALDLRKELRRYSPVVL